MKHSPENIIKFATRLAITSDLYRGIIEKRLTAHDLTPAQLAALTHLARRAMPLRVSDIARAIDVGQPAVTKMLIKFERAGWVTLSGSKQDGRVKEASLTRDGGMHLQKVHRSLMPELPSFLDNWSEEQLHHMTDELKSLSNFLETVQKLDVKA
ncbi:DNA-binding MarR family transcriptional regulator [Pacificibacter maritimus]|uniref:DNA-binding MarR family transcriptional regulator n=1 Tax=Pacificibacter maritimus TaxID=762213 RepID=A0A3N4UFZ9_9RHOB|nr:DNA-binding MarR family transcriptional regulator [Pacificibacter maritimus]